MSEITKHAVGHPVKTAKPYTIRFKNLKLCPTGIHLPLPARHSDDSSITKSGTDFVREGSNVRKWLM